MRPMSSKLANSNAYSSASSSLSASDFAAASGLFFPFPFPFFGASPPAPLTPWHSTHMPLKSCRPPSMSAADGVVVAVASGFQNRGFTVAYQTGGEKSGKTGASGNITDKNKLWNL